MTERIRDFKPGEEKIAQDLLSLGLQAYGLQTDYDRTDADILDIQEQYINHGGLFRFMESDEQIIGMYGLFRVSQTVCELRKMYLHPAYKGRGFGHLLMQDALEKATEAGFSEMILETNSCLKEAIAMYLKYGFTDYTPEHLSQRCDRAMRRRL